MALKVRYSNAQTRVMNRFSGTKGADVASATNLTLGNDGNLFDVSGTTTTSRITVTDWNPGAIVTLQFDGILTLTHNVGTDTATNVSMLLRGGQNMTTAAGDRIVLQYNGTNWLELARTTAGADIVEERLILTKGADVASANDVTLGSDGNQFDITGTTAVMRLNPTGFTAGSFVILEFDGACVVHHNEGTDTATAKSLILQGAADFTTAAGDKLCLYYDGALWQEFSRTIVAGVGAESIAAGAVGTSELASTSVTAAKALVFFSVETLATGSEQSVAHGLGATPAGVLISMTEHPGTPDTGAMDIAEGTHTSTNVVFTATANIKVKILAWA